MIKTTPISKKSDVSKAKSILKVTPAEQPLNYFARFKMPGKPINGIPNYKKIKILADRFRELCKSELNAYPRVRSAVRLGAPTVGRIQPLLVCLESPEKVEKIMLVARDLRNSSNWFVRDRIFINRHLTKAEAAAAFQAREQRRLKERSTANNSDPSSAMSTTADAATSFNSVPNRSIDDASSCSNVIPPPPLPPFHQPQAPSVSS